MSFGGYHSINYKKLVLLPKYKNFNQTVKVGEYEIFLPDPPDLNKIANRELSQQKQKFYRTTMPSNWRSLSEGEKKTFEDAEITKVYKTGYWFWNNGVLTWMTGLHYLYCNWWKIDIGHPSYRWSNAKKAYLWWDIERDRNCAGLVEITNRRDGKTYFSMCMTYHATASAFDAHSGIQSKTNEDAKKEVFIKALVRPYKKLPDFLKPQDDGNVDPKTSLSFTQPFSRSGAREKKLNKIVLDSYIDYEAVGENAYDGSKLLRYVRDEFGKVTDANVYLGHDVLKECLVDGNKIVGKCLYTSTVEEMEKRGGKNAKKLWEDSDPLKIGSNGRTPSMLRRYFKPADEGYGGEDNTTGEAFIDEYGNDRLDKDGVPLARHYFLRERADFIKRRDSEGLIRHKRKYPLYIKECFTIDNKESRFDQARINEGIERIEALIRPEVTRGNFVWKNGVADTEVEWQPSENGRWEVTELPEQTNAVRWNPNNSRNICEPLNTAKYCSGTDPYDKDRGDIIDKKNASNAGSHVFRKFDPLIDDEKSPFSEWKTYKYVSEYLFRQEYAPDYYEDMIKQCVFYGTTIFPETDKTRIIYYFRDRGYGKFLHDRPDETKAQSTNKVVVNTKVESGMPSRTLTIGFQEEAMESYLYDHYLRIPFVRMLEQLRDYETKDRTPYDAAVSAMFTIMAAQTKSKRRDPVKVPTNLPFFKKYDNRGIQSIPMKVA